MGKFKVFDTIDKFMKLYEADEDPAAAEGGEMPAEGDAANDATNPPAEGQGEDPAANQEEVKPTNSMSDEELENYIKTITAATKVEMVKLVVDALMMQPPPSDRIPTAAMSPNPNNVDAVIEALKGLTAIERPLSLNDQAPGENMANALKQTSSGSL